VAWVILLLFYAPYVSCCNSENGSNQCTFTKVIAKLKQGYRYHFLTILQLIVDKLHDACGSIARVVSDS